MAISCLVVDDQSEAVDVITYYIEDTPGFTLAFATTDPLAALHFLESHVVDVVFLDINMPKLDGMELLRLAQGRSRFVFTTAHKDYAAQSYEYGAVDYLVKPVSFERFLKAAQKIRTLVSEKETAALPTAPAAGSPLAEEYILVKSENKGKIVKISLSDIKYIEARKGYISIYAHPDRCIVTMLSISDIEDRLPVQQFVRVHRSYIVALKEILSVEGNSIITKDGYISIGISYKEAFFEVIKDKIINKKGE